jgi:hypothetical protein
MINWEKILKDTDISLNAIDIGCSGFRPHQWDRLGSQINYFGIDPLESEIKKLALENHLNSKYVSGFVSSPGGNFSADEGTQYFFNRSSAFHDMNNGFDLVKENFNSGQDVVYSDKKYSMDELIRESGFENVDLLKIDVDGDDYPLLLAFSNTNASNSILALDIESQFHGNDDKFGNTFTNISIKAKELGLHLFDIETFKYSRKALPAPYVHNFPAQTISGQVLWADSVFMRDSLELNETKSLIKLAALYDVYGLPDCAFELLQYHAEKLISSIPVTEIQHELIRAQTDSQQKRLGIFKRISKKIMK